MSNDLRNQIVSLQISEPWNFEVSSGGNTILGTINGDCHLPKESYLKGNMVLLSLKETLVWNDVPTKQLLLSARYVGQPILDICSGKSVTVNVARVKLPNIYNDGDNIVVSQIEDFGSGSVKTCAPSKVVTPSPQINSKKVRNNG